MTAFNGFATYTDHLVAMEEENPGLFLGKLAWYTVPESVEYDFVKFGELVTKHGPPVSINRAPTPSDIFLRACTYVAGKKQKLPQSDGTYANYLIRKVGSDEDFVVKNVVREIVDEENHRLDLQVIGELRFHKRLYTIEGKPVLTDTEFPQLVIEVKKYYIAKANLLTAYTIREGYRRALEGPMRSISVRTAGGVYFVPPSQSDALRGLEALSADIPGISFHVLPLLDDGNQREMLKAAFERDSVGELAKLMADVNTVLDEKGELTEKQMTAFQVRYTELRTRTKDYSELLDDALGNAAASLTLTKEVIKNALTKVKIPEDKGKK